ncbi:MAG: hypothetical protein U0V48_17620 [Anaerolineales bacterium]
MNRHLEQLTTSEVIHEADGVYDLDAKAIRSLARSQLKDSRPQYEEQPVNVRKVLKSYLNADGTVKKFRWKRNERLPC